MVREGVLLGVGVGVLGRVRKGMGLYVTGSLVGLLEGFGKRLTVCVSEGWSRFYSGVVVGVLGGI